MSTIGVIHLIWGPCGIGTFRAFLQSYIDKPAGIEHDLILVFNGFASEKATLEYEALAGDIRHASLFIKEPRFDIRSYYMAADAFRYDVYCLLNSYSVILDSGWLARLYDSASHPQVGLVGATGSALSWHSHLLDTRDALKTTAPYRGPVGRLRLMARVGFYARYFEPFPNYHVRTTGFMLSRELFLRVRPARRLALSTKVATYLFESGNNSMTKQIQRMGLRTLVIGRDGRAYDPDAWWESNTFWQDRQRNLLIADNQTNRFTAADTEEQWQLARSAWGARAAVDAAPAE